MIGQIVQCVKDNLPHDASGMQFYVSSMAKESAASEFEAAFIARTRELRDRTGMTAEQMATALGIPAERYRKYEKRGPMPHGLMERFALITGCTLEYLVTGKAKRPAAKPTDLNDYRASIPAAAPSKTMRKAAKK